MKIFLIYATLTIVNFLFNFLIYNYSFNLQATPFLHEEQKLDSGLLMLKITIPAYIVSALVMSAMFFFIARYIKCKK